ncbi:MAG TPA: hypothetical protein VIW72_03840, partial [Burkholderiales bacterium]
MEGIARTRFTPKQKAELWKRWKNGQCIADIARGWRKILAIRAAGQHQPMRMKSVTLRAWASKQEVVAALTFTSRTAA